MITKDIICNTKHKNGVKPVSYTHLDVYKRQTQEGMTVAPEVRRRKVESDDARGNDSSI